MMKAERTGGVQPGRLRPVPTGEAIAPGRASSSAGPQSREEDAVEELRDAVAFALARSGAPPAPIDLSRLEPWRDRNQRSARNLVEVIEPLGIAATERRMSTPDLKRLRAPTLLLLDDGRLRFVERATDEGLWLRRPTRRRGVRVLPATLEREWSGEAVTLGPVSISGSGGAHPTRPLRALLTQRGVFGEAALAAVFANLLTLAAPVAVLLIIDKVIVHNAIGTLDVLIIGLVLTACFEFILEGSRDIMLRAADSRLHRNLSVDLFAHLLRIPANYFRSRETAGGIVSRFADVERVKSFYAQQVVPNIVDGLFVLVFLCFLFLISPTLALVALAALPIHVGLTVFASLRQSRLIGEQRQSSASNQSRLVESISGIETIHAMAIEDRFVQAWAKQQLSGAAAASRAFAISSRMNRTGKLVGGLTRALLLWIGTQLVVAHEISLGQFIAFNLIALRLSAPISRFSRFWLDLQHVQLSAQRIEDVFDEPIEQAIDGARLPTPVASGRISFRDVSFSYESGGPDVLKGVSFDIYSGQEVAVVGRSGSGKTTLLKLLHGLMLPTHGSVLIDGVDTRDVDLQDLRRQFGVVLQDSALFARTVRENIALADPTMPGDAVVAAARLAGAHEFIARLPNGYDTPLGERGLRLSGGQRQRIALARALATEASVLVLDEVASALDYETIKNVVAGLRAAKRERTVVHATHRLSLARKADVILVLNQGRLVESGTHAELKGRAGQYARLVASRRETT